jgi:hypothetical protein
MAQIIADRVKETSTSTGTGAFTLAGAMTGFKTFSSVCANSDTVYYAIQGVDGTGSPTAEWEVGFGSWGTGGVLTRTTVYSSSNANALVNFSAGDKQVWIDAPANWLSKVDASSVTDFYTSGTYTVPSTATFVEVHAYGAGGGGASGRRGAAGALRTGGGGGGGGALHVRKLKASDLTPTVLVTVGAGGVGGVATTVNDTNGSFGSNGGNSTFGSYVTGYGGGGGRAGSNAAMNGGGGGGVAGAGNSTGTGGAPLVGATINVNQQFGGGSGADPSSAGKDSAYGGGGGGHCNTTSNSNAGTSVFSGGGGAGGGGISAANTSNPCASAGGTYGITIPSTTNQGMINGASGNDFCGGHGGASVVLQSTLQFQQIAYGDSKFVGVGVASTESFFSTSADGTTGWNMSPIPVGSFIVSNVLYGASKWVFYNTTQIYTSVDLATFSVATPPSGVVMNHIAYSGGLYIAVGTSGAISTSPDLITWTPRTSGVSANLFAATHNGTKWIVVGQNGVTLTSTDGISWTLVTIAGTPFLFSVAANGTTVVAHSSTSPFAHYSTDSGATWNSASTVVANGSGGTGNKLLVYAGGRFVLIGGSAVYTSTDGNTWTLQADGTTDTYSGVAGNGTIYVIGSFTGNSNVGISSTDGVTWTPRTFTDSRTITAGGSGGNGGIVAGGGGGSASLNGHNSGAGGNGGNGFVRVYAW